MRNQMVILLICEEVGTLVFDGKHSLIICVSDGQYIIRIHKHHVIYL